MYLMDVTVIIIIQSRPGKKYICTSIYDLLKTNPLLLGYIVKSFLIVNSFIQGVGRIGAET